eukprot:TRINITY_DN16260_c0_g2_i1.p1 TRINITY_DN16260_c0_g2~~TRINITY_DN16260_c0_g2_i1.p1  ORF type:complete len:136 (-),score=0.19 TRINITY_DN16260_c0_g2_i1:244-651(-)
MRNETLLDFLISLPFLPCLLSRASFKIPILALFFILFDSSADRDLIVFPFFWVFFRLVTKSDPSDSLPFWYSPDFCFFVLPDLSDSKPAAGDIIGTIVSIDPGAPLLTKKAPFTPILGVVFVVDSLETNFISLGT